MLLVIDDRGYRPENSQGQGGEDRSGHETRGLGFDSVSLWDFPSLFPGSNCQALLGLHDRQGLLQCGQGNAALGVWSPITDHSVVSEALISGPRSVDREFVAVSIKVPV
ncbi:MAG: hypothetical protein CM15mP120_29860 [Pseudomonadota bacterium]|nr:MAG: hypothetical protein CM15mP120_29860 [Pseudomonadota bacterium]